MNIRSLLGSIGASTGNPTTFQTLAAEDAHQLANELRILVSPDMSILSVEVPRDQEKHGSVVIRGRLRRPSHEIFPVWLAELNRRGYTPFLRPVLDSNDQLIVPGDSALPSSMAGMLNAGNSDENQSDTVALHVVAGVVPKSPSRPIINLVLFIITLLSTLFVGSLYGTDNPASTATELLLPQNLLLGWPFAVTLLGILTAHEFGHYFAARYHNVSVTLPFFLPMPLGFGTLGAFIRLKEPVPDLRKLFDIGVAGPLAGLVLAIPLLFLGLYTSPVEVPQIVEGAMLEGNSILYYYAKIAVFGQPLPNPVTGEDVLMNQVTFAAWIGLLVTALNLLPVGQLDGGHTVFALFGERARIINLATAGVMALFAIAGLEQVQQMLPIFQPFLEAIGFSGWFVWLALIFFMIGPFHPPALDDVTRLNPERRWVGYLIIVLFILTFVPVPMRPL